MADANEGDAEALAALFSETFRETFGHLYKPADLAAFLSEHTAGHWQEQLRDGAFAVRMAEANGVALFDCGHCVLSSSGQHAVGSGAPILG